MTLVDFLLKEYIVIFVCLCMSFLLITQPQEKRKDDVFLILIYVSILITAIVVELEHPLMDKPELDNIRYVFSITAYILRPVIIALLCLLIDRNLSDSLLFWIPIIINTLTYISAPFTQLPFYFENGIWMSGPLVYMMFLVCIIYMVILLWKMYLVFISVEVKEFILLLLAATMGVGAGILWMKYTNEGNLYLSALSVAIMVIYIYIHIQKSKEKDIERVEKINENELELQKKNAELMISQIQPHFLYNTLSSIKYLIKDNPELASETLEKFSQYLRGNMSAIGNNDPITFEMEMEQVENYVFIEKIRFPYISVEYDITDDIFDLPSLTVQPLVENAIKHGIRGKKDGIVKVRTWYAEETHFVEVSDNGVGFDKENTDMHVGLENVRKRLELMVKGRMIVNSTPGKGTVITLEIPENEEML